MKTFLSAAALALALVSVGQAADATRYIALVNGGKDKAGHLVETHSGNKYKVDFVFKDNGRGPELKEEFTLADDGTFTSYKVKGVSTFGSLVNETFTRSGNTARWKSTSDKGEQGVQGTAIYSPLNGTPQSFSVALTALAKRPDGRLAMIPSGTLTSRKLTEVEVTHGASKRKVQ